MVGLFALGALRLFLPVAIIGGIGTTCGFIKLFIFVGKEKHGR
jgi:hypothetical protein